MSIRERRVVVYVSGGVVQDVISDMPGETLVIDYDTDGQEPLGKDSRGDPCNMGLWDGTDAERVAAEHEAFTVSLLAHYRAAVDNLQDGPA